MEYRAREDQKTFRSKVLSLSSFKPEYLRLVLLGLLGVTLLWLGSSLVSTPKAKDTPGEPVIWNLEECQARIAKEVENVVSSIKGAGKVKARVSLEEGPFFHFVTNETKTRNSSTEVSKEGEKRETISESETSQPVTGRGLDSQGGLVPQKVSAPKISGCVVVAQGASSPQVKTDIYRAVSILLDIPIYKIVVLPMEGGR